MATVIHVHATPGDSIFEIDYHFDKPIEWTIDRIEADRFSIKYHLTRPYAITKTIGNSCINNEDNPSCRYYTSLEKACEINKKAHKYYIEQKGE